MSNLDSLVSVVIPIFNSEKYIEETILSVINQSHKNIEILVIDDNSTDLSYDIVKSLKSKYRKIQVYKTSFNSGGPALPRNLGIKKSKGKYVCFLDSDDIWSPRKIEKQFNILENSKHSMCASSMIEFSTNEKIFLEKKFDINTEKNYKCTPISYFNQLIKYSTPTSSIMIRRNLAQKISFNENKIFHGREDVLYMLEYYEKYGSGCKLTEPLVFYRRHSNQISSNKLKMQVIYQWIILKTIIKTRYAPLLVFILPLNIFLTFLYRVILKKL